MAPDRRDPSTRGAPSLFGKVVDPPITKQPDDDVDFSQMRDGSRPNGSASVADATGSSGEEELESAMSEEAS